MRRKSLASGLAIVATAVALTAGVTASAQRDALEGVFAYAGGERELLAVRRAIESATQALPRRQRIHTAARLEETARPAPRLVLSRDGRQLVVSLNGSRSLASADDGSAATVKADLSLRSRMDGSVLEQVLSSSDLTQVYRYTLSGDRQQLSVSVELQPAGLPAIRYRLTYARR